MIAALVATLLVSSATGAPVPPDWSEGARVPPEGRGNIYQLPADELTRANRAGRVHALHYPIEITGLLLPHDTIDAIYKTSDAPIRKFLGKIIGGIADFKSLDELFAWVGLHEYPAEEGTGAYFVPYPEGRKPDYRMGYRTIDRHGVPGITLSCAGCHSANLFGRKVIGLTNRFPRANHVFLTGKKGMNSMPPNVFQLFTGASRGDREMYAETRVALKRVGIKDPVAIGLDTSLAQVAMSLARRDDDEYATPSKKFENSPRHEPLAVTPADSKPAVWWNLKYKNRWLSDGSIVSGNPILTNFLWNEIGRGTDLLELDRWLQTNQRTVDDLTAAVFAAEAPRMTDFFPAETFEPARVERGRIVFQNRCAGCHGTYEKAWTLPEYDHAPWIERLKTTRVTYHATTPVIDVGTDAFRRRGMTSLERVLNPLTISKREGILVREQKGYVPPPLVGIWARWPYFHNNAAPSLCAVLTRAVDRPSIYRAGPALDKEADFDRECNGYPLGGRMPPGWMSNDEWYFDTGRPGMGNRGHDEGIFLKDGKELLTRAEKRDLIGFLQTL